MTDQELLLLLLAAIYLSECLAWVHASVEMVQFSRLHHGTFHGPQQGLGNDRGRFFLSQPWPWWAGSFAASRTERSFDLAAAQARWEGFRADTKGVFWGTNLGFFLLFMGLPLVWRLLGVESPALLITAGILLTCGVITAILHHSAHGKYFPDRTGERWQQTLLIALLPTHACRAHDLLGRPLLEKFHPLVLAALALPKGRFEKLARRTLRSLRHPLPPASAANPPTPLEIFLAEQGITLTAPAPNPGATHYCPRCESQFSPPAETCPDCRGMALVKLTGTPENAADPNAPEVARRK